MGMGQKLTKWAGDLPAAPDLLGEFLNQKCDAATMAERGRTLARSIRRAILSCTGPRRAFEEMADAKILAVETLVTGVHGLELTLAAVKGIYPGLHLIDMRDYCLVKVVSVSHEDNRVAYCGHDGGPVAVREGDTLLSLMPADSALAFLRRVNEEWDSIAARASECGQPALFGQEMYADVVASLSGAAGWSEDEFTPYCSLRQHAKACGVSASIFHNSERWKGLLDSGLAKSHGQYHDWAFRWSDLLPLVQAHDLTATGPTTTMATLRRKYRVP